ncbi:hypothetical protein BHE74_00004139 [Ensete ventricosum]|nr:hypothetical protein BHE74_00004139 [Ensete ventricosum]RZR81654.1 hypothetical protein BHM03_00007916 [Ensete ventricosum]
MVELYGGPIGAVVWGEDMVRHAAFMARGGGVGMAPHPDPSTSAADSGPQSLSSGIMAGADAKALQALEAMKLHHDFDSTMSHESLVAVRKRFSIPNEYVLHAPGPRQQPYHSCPGGFSISIDALEARLRFPLHPVIGECLERWRISPGQVASNSWRYIITFLGECKGSGIVPNRDLFLSCFRFMMRGNPRTGEVRLGAASSVPASTLPPPPAPRAESGLASEVQEIPVEEVRGAPEIPRKRRGEDPAGHRKRDRRKSPHKANRAATKGKAPTDTAKEPPAPRRKPKSVRELCSASARVDGRDYHTTRMCNLPERAPDAPLDVDLRPLTHGMLVWQDREALAKYIRGTLIPRLASDLYTLPSKVLMDGQRRPWCCKVTLLCQEVQRLKEGGDPDAVAAAEARASEAQSLVEHLQVKLDKANGRRESTKLEGAQAESTNLRRQLDDSESQLRSTRTQVRQMETELLELTQSKDALWVDLPRRAIKDYK